MNQGEIVIEEIGEDGNVITPLSSLAPQIQKRVLYLKELQDEYETNEGEYEKEQKALDQKYAAIYDKIHAKRAAIVMGETDAPENVGNNASDSTSRGIPRFWVQAMQNCNNLVDMIQENDEDVLEHLVDIRCEDLYGTEGEEDEGEEGFKLTFEFAENPYFTDKQLTKTYHMDDEGLTATEGSEIHWKPGKNITVKVLKKRGAKKGSKMETKTERLPSFFHFFTPPALPEDPRDATQAMAAAVQEDYENGEAFRDELIPNAVSFFLGEVEQEEDEDDYDEDDEDDDDDDDEDDDDDSEDDEDSEAEEAPVARKKRGPKDSKRKEEECKQQ